MANERLYSPETGGHQAGFVDFILTARPQHDNPLQGTLPPGSEQTSLVIYEELCSQWGLSVPELSAGSVALREVETRAELLAPVIDIHWARRYLSQRGRLVK